MEFGLNTAGAGAIGPPSTFADTLNYNACTDGDGEPVTLKCADAVGEVLTAGPVTGAPLPFRLYI